MNLNPLAQKIWKGLVSKYPDWAEYLDCAGEDLEVAIPAPAGSKAGQLVVFTNRGQDIWLRYAPPNMCYLVENEEDMLSVIEQLVTDSALFMVVMTGEDWAETTLVRPDVEPTIEEGQVAHVVSWSGNRDRVVAR